MYCIVCSPLCWVSFHHHLFPALPSFTSRTPISLWPSPSCCLNLWGFFFSRNLFVTEQKLFFRCLQPPTGNFPRQRLVEKKRGPYSKIPQFRKTGHSPALGSSLPQQKSPSVPPKTKTVPRNPTPLEREAAKWMALRLQAPSQGLHVGLAQKLPCSFQDLVNPTNALAHTLCQRIRKENVHISPFSLFQSFGSNFLAHWKGPGPPGNSNTFSG